MNVLQVVKVKPKPNGWWLTDLRYTLRVLRECADFIIVVKDEHGADQMFEKKDIVGKNINIKGNTYVLRPDGKVIRVFLSEPTVTT